MKSVPRMPVVAGSSWKKTSSMPPVGAGLAVKVTTPGLVEKSAVTAVVAAIVTVPATNGVTAP